MRLGIGLSQGYMMEKIPIIASTFVVSMSKSTAFLIPKNSRQENQSGKEMSTTYSIIL